MRSLTCVCVTILGLHAGDALADHLRITLASAQIDGKKLKGAGKPMPGAQLSDLVCLSSPGLRDIWDMCGVRFAADGVTQLPPAQHPEHDAPVDPLLRLEIGDRVVSTYPVPATLSPKWEYSVIVAEDMLEDGDSVAFVLYDYDGPGAERKLGDKLVKARAMTKPGEYTLKGVGPATVKYRVERVAEAGRTYKYRVPAAEQMADLARKARTTASATGEYLVVPVAEGEVVEVRASGKVQPNARKYPDRVAGPKGIPTITTKIQFNQPGFRGCPGCDHSALIGQLGGKGFVVGEHKKWTAENAGLLVLAINDLKTADNGGAFDVVVTVTAPRGDAERGTMKSKKDAGAGLEGLDPRVVQQVVDSHGAELDACALQAKDPNGEIVLQFSIAGDGNLLGVVVEKASPNLRQAGECMRGKALRWRFPAPHNVVTARYPLSFSAG